MKKLQVFDWHNMPKDLREWYAREYLGELPSNGSFHRWYPREGPIESDEYTSHDYIIKYCEVNEWLLDQNMEESTDDDFHVLILVEW